MTAVIKEKKQKYVIQTLNSPHGKEVVIPPKAITRQEAHDQALELATRQFWVVVVLTPDEKLTVERLEPPAKNIEESIKLGHLRRYIRLLELNAPEAVSIKELNGYFDPKVRGLDLYGLFDVIKAETRYGNRCGEYALYHTDIGPIALFSSKYGRSLVPFQGRV